jgi:hypothetical protein
MPASVFHSIAVGSIQIVDVFRVNYGAVQYQHIITHIQEIEGRHVYKHISMKRPESVHAGVQHPKCGVAFKRILMQFFNPVIVYVQTLQFLQVAKRIRFYDTYIVVVQVNNM